MNIQIISKTDLPSHWLTLWPHHQTASVPPAPVDIQLELTPMPDWYSGFDTDGDFFYQTNAKNEVTQIRIEHPFFWVELAATQPASAYHGQVTIRQNGLWPMIMLIRACLALLAVLRNQVMWHASGVVRNGRLWAFSGPAESGKTTIVEKLNNGGQVFSIDRIVLNNDTTAATGVIAAGTPFSDETGQHLPCPSMPLSGICFIEKSNAAASVRKLPVEEFLSRFLNELLVFRKDAGIMMSLMDLAARIYETIPVYHLRFPLNETFWPLIDTPGASNGN
ncbi:MAG: hypothetical protein JXR76_22125 [Deltaproteobacteria bacterium]|nr:hypothetical protein [Deltaproteobacteria bacterium]